MPEAIICSPKNGISIMYFLCIGSAVYTAVYKMLLQFSFTEHIVTCTGSSGLSARLQGMTENLRKLEHTGSTESTGSCLEL